MDLLITGASGFLGAQLATQWLRRDPGARVAALVRGADDDAARARLHAALRRAASDQAMDDDMDAMLARVEPVRAELADPAWVPQARAWLRGPAELVHCAANLSFREADRDAVWQANVEGTRALLAALPLLPQVRAFDHVSTAYVAGDREGVIPEDDGSRPQRFNNPYEESKWAAEALVRAACPRAGVGWRVLRPSIVIAHSVTHRMASQSGLYQVAETLLQFGRRAANSGAREVLLPVSAGATLDLIPVDAVVGQMLALLGRGEATHGRTFHLTSGSPLPLADVLRELSPMSGVPIGVAADPAADPSPQAAVVMRRLRYYMPYFSFVRRFDRANATRAGVEPDRLDVAQLRGFLDSFVAQQEAARA